MGEELSLGRLVERHVGAAEAVDRLLGIADDEELAGDGARAREVVLEGIVGREQEQDLGLEGVGVLELVDEQVREALLELAADGRVLLDEVPGEQEQVEEVEPPAARLARAVGLHERAEIFAQAGGEVGVGLAEEGVESALGRLPLREGLLAGDVLGEPLATALPPPELAPRERAQLLFEPVVVAPADVLAPLELRDEALDLEQALRAPVAPVEGPRREGGQRREVVHQPIDLPVAVERVAPPGGVEVALLHEGEAGLAQHVLGARSLAVARLATQHAPHALGRGGEHRLEPPLERLVEDPPLLVLVGGLEERVDARLDGPLPQDLGAEAVDRPDVRLLELGEREVEAGALLLRGAAAGALDLGAKPELHLAGGLLGEGHRDEAGERRLALLEERHHAVHELGRLPRAGRGLDDERRVEIAADAIARLLVGEDPGPRHGSLRSVSRGMSSSRRFRFVRSSS